MLRIWTEKLRVAFHHHHIPTVLKLWVQRLICIVYPGCESVFAPPCRSAHLAHHPPHTQNLQPFVNHNDTFWPRFQICSCDGCVLVWVVFVLQ